MRNGSTPATSAKTFATVCLFILAIWVGRASMGGGTARADDELAMRMSGSPGADATATREIELAELSMLRTQIASGSSACTPAATTTATATPTPVPPVAGGQSIAYGEDWEVTVVDISLMPTFGKTTAKGIYAKVSIIAVNGTSSPQRFPYDNLVLKDALGRAFLPAFEVKIQNESNYFAWYPPSVPTDGFVMFDTPADATGPFVLESTTDPTFRVLIDVEERG